MPYEILLGILTFVTSTVAGAVGIGGGMMLIAILPSLSILPVNALIPVHGMTQMSSNLSRAFFGYKSIRMETIPKFLIGSLVGIGFFASVLAAISLEYVPLFIAIYILLSLWSKSFNSKIKRYENYYLIGFLQTGLSIVVGATGPLAMSLLLKEYKDKEVVVATAAALMSITHTLKVIVFIFFGFVFWDYAWVLVFMIVGAVAGSYVGTRVRGWIDGDKFVLGLRILLSLLAVRMIAKILL